MLIPLILLSGALVMLLAEWWFRKRYGTRAERAALEKKLLKDLEYLRNDPFTNARAHQEQDQESPEEQREQPTPP